MWKSFAMSWKNIFNYTGRTGRKDFWLASLMSIIMMYAGLMPFALVLLLLKAIGLIYLIPPAGIAIVYMLVFLVPQVSLYVRRGNDVGLRRADTVFIAVAAPIIGAIIMGVLPSSSGSSPCRLPWYVQAMAIGFALYLYGGFVGMLILNSLDAVVPVVGAGLILATVSMICGAISVKMKKR